MIYMGRYDSPLGPITLAGEDGALTGLWFDGQKYFGAGLPAGTPEGEPPVFRRQTSATGLRVRWISR